MCMLVDAHMVTKQFPHVYDLSINLQMQQQLVCFGQHMAHTITDSSATHSLHFDWL